MSNLTTPIANAFASLTANRNTGVTLYHVRVVGDSEPFGKDICGASFATPFDAICFLKRHGLDYSPIGIWYRAA